MKWDDLLDDISRVLPAGSWLSSLNMQAGTTAPAAAGPTPATATAPTAFTVSGVAFTQDDRRAGDGAARARARPLGRDAPVEHADDGRKHEGLPVHDERERARPEVPQ